MNKDELSLKIEAYGSAPEALEAILTRFQADMWSYKPAPDSWSIKEIVFHLADSEVHGYIRCRTALAEPGKTVMAYDQDLWARTVNYPTRSVKDALELFRLLRKSTYELLKTLPDSAWSLTMEHSERGTMTLEQWLDTYERHVPGHIQQMYKVYEAWKRQRA
ncbi:MAG: DinB family protein [Acidobacteriota bacterium]